MLEARRFVQTFLLLAVSVVSAHAQSIHTLQGKVIAPSGTQPPNPVMVTLTFSGRPIYETFTDLSGRFSFTALSKGRYQLTAKGDGVTFESTSVYADISAFGNAPQLFTQDIPLRPVAGTPAQRAAVVNAFTQDVPRTARQELKSALKLIDEKQPERAMEKLQKAVRLFPEYFEAHLQLGNEYLKAVRFEEAITHFDRAREINPKDERVYQSFGLLMMKQRKYPIAVAIFEEAARLNPTNPLNPLMRASSLVYQASYVDPESVTQRNDLLKQAELALSQASGLSEKKLKLDSLTLAMFYELKGQPSKAADELEDYLRKTTTAKNAEAIKNEISRLRLKATKITP